jgi:hypothetical protein
MRFMLRTILVCLLLALPAHAITLDDVRKSLAEYPGATPVNMKIDSTHLVRGEGKTQMEESRGTLIAEDDGTNLRIVHAKKDLRRPGKKNRASHGLPAGETFSLMNYAPELLQVLQGATLKKVTQTTLDGAPATLLEITPLREKDEDGDKWIKSYVDTLLLWIGPGGVPMAAERTHKIKARIVLIPVEFSRNEKLRFARAGDRLMVTKWSYESAGSGMGQSEAEKKSATLSIVR